MGRPKRKKKKLRLGNLKEKRKTLHSDLELALIYEDLHITSQIEWTTIKEGVIIDLKGLTQKQARLLGQELFAHNFITTPLEDKRFIKVIKIGGVY